MVEGTFTSINPYYNPSNALSRIQNPHSFSDFDELRTELAIFLRHEEGVESQIFF